MKIYYIFQKKKFKTVIPKDIARSTLYRYRQMIKNHLAINEYTSKIKQVLQQEATSLANNFVHRKKIFYYLIELSKKLKIEIPSYTELSKLITIALHNQRKDIINRLEAFSEDEKLKTLDEFLDKNQDSKNRYNLTYYRRLEHSTKKNQMILSLAKLDQINQTNNLLFSALSTINT